jgi:hypothetical protein
LNNASELIIGLRQKISQQKEILGRAKQELSNFKMMKEQMVKLQEENDDLKKQLQNMNNQKIKSQSICSPAISIKMLTPHNQSKICNRISIKSPSFPGGPPQSPTVADSTRYITLLSSCSTPFYQHQHPKLAFPSQYPQISGSSKGIRRAPSSIYNHYPNYTTSVGGPLRPPAPPSMEFPQYDSYVPDNGPFIESPSLRPVYSRPYSNYSMQNQPPYQ